jgi:glyoxylase-like metal-dependent hydrolase (beta-lactamase superfamily II)
VSWDELAEGVYRKRYESLDLNIGLVVGDAGALVFDTRASHRQAQVLLDDIRKVTASKPRWAVNSHWHWDHTFGNHEFAGVAIYGHERCRERLLADGEAAKEDALAWVGEAGRAHLDEVVISPPTNTFTDTTTIDLGDRTVALSYLGLAHTDNDIVMTISGTDVVFAGDVIEESAPPYFGDSFPLAWPDTVRSLMDIGSVFVPGHGEVMSPDRVATQHEELTAIATALGEYLVTGLFDPTKGPYPEETMQAALARLPQRTQGSR